MFIDETRDQESYSTLRLWAEGAEFPAIFRTWHMTVSRGWFHCSFYFVFLDGKQTEMFLFSHRSTSCSSLRGEGCLDIKGPKREEDWESVVGRLCFEVILSRQGALFGQCALCVCDFQTWTCLVHRLLVFIKKTFYFWRAIR
jgi:hypothetical protein